MLPGVPRHLNQSLEWGRSSIIESCPVCSHFPHRNGTLFDPSGEFACGWLLL